MRILNLLPRNENPAISDLKGTVSYNELHHSVGLRMAQLDYIQERDVVWVECTNSMDTLINYIALWEKNVCIVPIDPQLGNSELEHLATQLPPQYIVSSSNSLALKNIIGVKNKNADILNANLIQLSSGTTGRAKIILISLEALIFRASSYRDQLGLSEKDRTLCSVPLSHSHGIDCLSLPTLFAGGQLFLRDPLTSYPFRILDWIEKNQISYFSSLPQIYDLFNQLSYQKSCNLTSLRHAFCGSAALSESTAEEFNRRFHLHLKQGYGLAEIGVICANFSGDTSRYSSIGRPIDGMDWKIDADGELLVRSKALFTGYYRDSKETMARFNGNFLRTEDIVSIDELGLFYISGRKNDVIQVMGQKVYPKEIEQRLGRVRGVADLCVTGQVDSDRGQVPVLHLVPDGSIENHQVIEKDIFELLSVVLEDFKIPRKFIWHKDFPKSPLGKVLKSKL